MSNTAFNSNYVSSSGSNSTQDFRLTLASNTPVMTSEVLAATTLYLTPYVGNKISLYNGSTWTTLESSEVSISLASISADTNYDVFAYNNAGAVSLELLAWSNSGAGTSTRTTALVYQNGVLVKSGAVTRRYIGTIRGSASGQCQFSFGGIDTSAIEAKLFVWNSSNQVESACFVASNSSSWTFVQSSAAVYVYRAALASANFRVSFVSGLAESPISANYSIHGATSAGSGSTGIALGLNSTSSAISTAFFNSGTNISVNVSAQAEVLPSSGFNYISALEVGSGGVNAIFYGYGGAANGGQPRVYGLFFRGKF